MPKVKLDLPACVPDCPVCKASVLKYSSIYEKAARVYKSAAHSSYVALRHQDLLQEKLLDQIRLSRKNSSDKCLIPYSEAEQKMIDDFNTAQTQSDQKVEQDVKLFKEALTSYQKEDLVNHPKHYNSHPSGIECIQVTEHMGFNLGNAVKYIWRADLKNDALEDLKKAVWYLQREIEKRERK